VRAVLLREPGDVAVETVPDPSPGRDEVVVAVHGCGICGTDRHILDEGLPTARYPLIPGHEPWGEVVAVGHDVRGVRAGDVVGVDPSLHCGECDRCRRGQGNHCRRWGAIGGTVAGAWADLVAVPAANAHRLGEDYPLEVASIVEPVACALRGLERLRPRPDASALVVGGGTMGLLLAILLELRGVGPITVLEPNDERRALGATLVDARFAAPGELADQEEFEQVVDATGVPAAVEGALARVAPGGTFMVFGVSAPEARVAFSPFEVYRREITIVGSMAILRTYAPAVEVTRRHAERFRPLMTHAFGLGGFGEAIATLPRGSAIKVTLDPRLP
jgi:NADPH2:quinone reductase